MNRLEIGIASYENPHKLQSTLDHLLRYTEDLNAKILVVDNNSQNPQVKNVIETYAQRTEGRVVPIFNPTNRGYAGAVNQILSLATSEYVAYCDNDAYVKTLGWDTTMTKLLDVHHEIGMLFPGGGPYPIKQPDYDEILWGVGCFWMLPHRYAQSVGLFDENIGHHEEVDYQTRMRLAGLKIAACRNIIVQHDASASSNPASAKRIADGVVKWVNKWNEYFCGKGQGYFSTNVLRHEDWPTSALHIERYWQQVFPDLNTNPESFNHMGIEYDLIRVPRFKGFYRGRVI